MDLLEQIKQGEVPHYKEIEKLDFSDAQACFAELRRLYINTDLKRPWKLTNNTDFVAIFRKYQIAKTTGGQVYVGQAAMDYMQELDNVIIKRNEKRMKNKKQEDTQKLQKDSPIIKGPTPPAVYHEVLTPTPVIRQPWIEETRNVISISRNYTSNELTDYLTRLSLYLSPESEFEVEITVKEIIKKEK